MDKRYEIEETTLPGYGWAQRIAMVRRTPWEGISREHWGDGEWDHEPDLVEWTNAAEQKMLLFRGPTGCWCGYVAVLPDSPLHGCGYHDDNIEMAIDVHGGVTFADEHAVLDLWCFGFDCSHAWDIAPAMDAVVRKSQGAVGLAHHVTKFASLGLGSGTHYRDVTFARLQTEYMAAQLLDLESRVRKSQADLAGLLLLPNKEATE